VGSSATMVASKKVLRSAIVFMMLGTANGQGVDTEEEFVDPEGAKATETATCVFDALQASGYLAQAGQLISASEVSCKESGHGVHPTECAAGVSGVVAAFANAAAFMGAAVSNCAGWPNFPSLCAADSIGVVASVAEIIQGSTGLYSNCDHAGGAPIVRRLLESNESFEVRRLQRTQAQNNALAGCVINTIQGTLWIGRAGLVIESFQHTCKPGPDWKYACAASSLALLASLGNVASYFAAVSAQCAKEDNKPAKCAADIAQIFAASNALANAGVNMRETCSAHNLEAHWQAVQMGRGDEADEEHIKKLGHIHNFISSELDKLANTSNIAGVHTALQEQLMAEDMEVEMGAKETDSRPVKDMQARARDDISARLQFLSEKRWVVV